MHCNSRYNIEWTEYDADIVSVIYAIAASESFNLVTTVTKDPDISEILTVVRRRHSNLHSLKPQRTLSKTNLLHNKLNL